MTKTCELENSVWEEHYCEFLDDCIKNGDHKAGSMALEQDRDNLTKDTYKLYREKFDSLGAYSRKL